MFYILFSYLVWNPVCILHIQHISIQASHVSGGP